MIEYTAEVHSSNCPSIFGDPSRISGASHKCLIPFISVACDTSIYAFGTIFAIPMLDIVEIAMPPSGKNKMKHPKHVVCEDTGSAIKGENRLDFYTGSYGLKSKANIFGSTGSDLLKMFGNKSCHPDKTFSSPLLKSRSDQAGSAVPTMTRMANPSGSATTRMIATASSVSTKNRWASPRSAASLGVPTPTSHRIRMPRLWPAT